MAQILAFPDPAVPTVYVLSGRSGVGKTRLLARYADRHTEGFAYYSPSWEGERFSYPVDFSRTPVVAIDDLYLWETAAMVDTVRRLERSAMLRQGRLILVVREADQFRRLGFTVSRDPVHISVTMPAYVHAVLGRLPAVRAGSQRIGEARGRGVMTGE